MFCCLNKLDLMITEVRWSTISLWFVFLTKSQSMQLKKNKNTFYRRQQCNLSHLFSRFRCPLCLQPTVYTYFCLICGFTAMRSETTLGSWTKSLLRPPSLTIPSWKSCRFGWIFRATNITCTSKNICSSQNRNLLKMRVPLQFCLTRIFSFLFSLVLK